MGAVGGFAGALNGDVISLTSRQLQPFLGQSGSLLPSSREPVLSQTDAETQLKRTLQTHQIDNILLFGGDGSLRYLPPFLKTWQIPCIGIPTTIDNNVPGSELSLGFDSACNFAYQTIDGIRATAHALPGRIFMVETLGGDCGNLALDIAAGAGAHAVLVPEYPYEKDWLSQRLVDSVEREGYALLIVCEGVAASRTLADDIPAWTKIRVRDTRLGHAQRGAAPSHRDRLLGADMARAAYEGFKNGVQSAVVVVQNGQIVLAENRPDEKILPDITRYHRINGL